MKLRPFDESTNQVTPDKKPPLIPEIVGDFDSQIEKVLAEANIAPAKLKGDKKRDLQSIRDMFDREGASVEKAAFTLGSLMTNADSDSGKLNAARMVLEVQGILKAMNDEGVSVPEVSIHIHGNGNQVNILNLIKPEVVPNV